MKVNGFFFHIQSLYLRERTDQPLGKGSPVPNGHVVGPANTAALESVEKRKITFPTINRTPIPQFQIRRLVSVNWFKLIFFIKPGNKKYQYWIILIVISSETKLSVYSQWYENFAFETLNESARPVISICLHAPFALRDQGRPYFT